MTTFEEARQIAADNRSARLDDPTFAILDGGWETPERWIFRYTCEATDSRPWLTVDKATGEYIEEPSVGEDPLPDKTPI